MKNTTLSETIQHLEATRCVAMVNGDVEKLKSLLHKDLIHVHAKGQVDGFESYFAVGGFKVNYTRLERSDLRVQVLGDVVLMTGRQILEAIRKIGGERIRIDSQVMQVWVEGGGSWQQLAFQTTPSEMIVLPPA
jgi:ketosteroid isomerase-like protein